MAVGASGEGLHLQRACGGKNGSRGWCGQSSAGGAGRGWRQPGNGGSC